MFKKNLKKLFQAWVWNLEGVPAKEMCKRGRIKEGKTDRVGLRKT